MFNYLAFLYGGIEAPTDNLTEDGKRLAENCMEKLKRLKNREQFPPKLLILLASPAFFKRGTAHLLTNGIYDVFDRKVRLIGSSAAAVFFRNDLGEHKIYPDGAVLVCLASRLIEPEVVVSEIRPKSSIGEAEQSGSDVGKAIDKVVTQLKLGPSISDSPSQLPHRLILSFFPSFGGNDIEARELTEKLQERLWRRVHYKIPIVGGVSSVNDPKRQALSYQFIDTKVYSKSIVAALISCGVPFDESLSNGIHWENQDDTRTLKAPVFSQSRMTIKSFDKRSPADLFKSDKGIILFKEGGRSSDRVVAISEPSRGSRKVRVLRKIRDDVQLVAGRPDAEGMYQSAMKSIVDSLESMGIENPIGCFSIKCTSHFRRQRQLKLKIEDGISSMSRRVLNNKPYVGGFLDGEIGTDKSGRSVSGNWGVATLVFGDEMSESALIQGGYAAMKAHTADLSSTFELDVAIEKSLKLIYDIGFPGAMLSLLLPNDKKSCLLPQQVVGSRFETIKDLNEFDGLAMLTRLAGSTKSTAYIPDSKKESEIDKHSVEKSGIVSRYMIRLKDPHDNSLGLLQVDLGEARKFYPAKNRKERPRQAMKRNLGEEEKKLLESVGAFIGACLNRVLAWKQNELAHRIDEASTKGTPSERVDEGLTIFLKGVLGAFGLEMAHIRLFEEKTRTLSLTAGVGAYFEAATDARQRIGRHDQAPGTYAFNNKKVVVVNDAPHSNLHSKLCASYDDVPRMKKSLDLVGSYANVPFKSPNGIQGTLNLLSEAQWFFKSYHRPVLRVLARTVAVLVDSLIRKEKEAFLRVASPKLSEITSVDEIRDFYSKATETFCEALGAEQGALYLLEKDISTEKGDPKFYILRAQYCWRGQDRVGTAFYRSDEGWVGNEAADRDEVLYFPDLLREYKKPRYRNPRKRYDTDIFGGPLSKQGPVEALAIPLKMGYEKLGVLTAYRGKSSSNLNAASGFRTIDPEWITQGVKSFAGWTNSASYYQDQHWDQAYVKRGQRIYEALSSSADPGADLLFERAGSFETSVCTVLRKELVAARVDFYRWGEPANGYFNWIAAASPQGVTTSEPPDADEWPAREMNKLKALAEAADGAKDKGKIRYKAYLDSTTLDTDQVAFQGTLRRACIPLISSNLLVGCLDIRWDQEKKQDPPLLGDRGARHLRGLGKQIGSHYSRHLLKRDTDKNRIAFHIIDSVARGKSHVLKNDALELQQAVLKMQSSRSARSARTATKLADHIVKLQSDRMELAYDFLTSSEMNRRYSAELKGIVDTILRSLPGSDLASLSKSGQPRFEPSNQISEGTNVIGIPVLIEFVFSNLIDNAIKQMKKMGRRSVQRPQLIITAREELASGGVQVFIKDTGQCMSPEHLERLNSHRGGLTTGKSAGLGIYLSKIVLSLMKGRLRHFNNEDGGVTAEVTLILENMEVEG